MNIKINVRTKPGSLPKDEVLIFNNNQLNHEDFSGKRLGRLSFTNSQLYRCKFENMDVDSAGFGGGLTQSIFTDCSFDRSKFKGPTAGNVRFVCCSFRNIDLCDFFFFKGEFIDCTFSGKLRKIIFRGKILSSHHREGLREFNEFYGNDFSDANLIDCDFRGGIDLSKQKLPQNEIYLYIKDSAKFINNYKNEMSFIEDPEFKKTASSRLKIYMENLSQGQTQFLLRMDELTVNAQYIAQMAALVRRAVA